MIVGHQAPLALWTAYALLKPWLGGGGAWCPTHHILGWCPTCGMTGEYSALLYTGRIPGLWTCCVLLAFAATSCWAFIRLASHAHRRALPAS